MAITSSDPQYIRIDTGDENRPVWRKTYFFPAPSKPNQFEKTSLDLKSGDVQRIVDFDGYLKIDEFNSVGINQRLNTNSYIISNLEDNESIEFLTFEMFISNFNWKEKDTVLYVDYTLVNEANKEPPEGPDPPVIQPTVKPKTVVVPVTGPYEALTPIPLGTTYKSSDELHVFLNGVRIHDFQKVNTENISLNENIESSNIEVTVDIFS